MATGLQHYEIVSNLPEHHLPSLYSISRDISLHDGIWTIPDPLWSCLIVRSNGSISQGGNTTQTAVPETERKIAFNFRTSNELWRVTVLKVRLNRSNRSGVWIHIVEEGNNVWVIVPNWMRCYNTICRSKGGISDTEIAWCDFKGGVREWVRQGRCCLSHAPLPAV